MTKANQQCQTPDMILDFLRGRLTSSEEESLQLHLDDCIACRQLLSNSAADEAAWDEAHQFFSSEALDNAMCIGEAQHLRAHGTNGEQTDEPESIESLLKLLGPTDDPRMLGRIGHYEIVGVLGRGGMGVVFKAYEPSLNRYVAIKLLLPHLAASGAARMRFAREGRAAAAVIDDNVLPIFSVSEWQGVPYLVTQLSRGSNLQKRINDSGPLELREILRLGMQTASGLAAAHAQGLVHRDIKPSNILLDGTVDRALLTDFGLARAVDDASITCSGIIAGTPQYMSPEQARGGSVDARSDLFGLGSVLYTMCTGRAPFRAENSFAVLRLITDVDPRAIREVNPDIPEWLCLIVAKLMAKSPEHRYQSAAEVAALLSACLAHVQQPTVVDLPDELREELARNRFANRASKDWRRTMAHYITYRMPNWLPCFLTTLLAFAVSIGPAMTLPTLPKETLLHSIPPVLAILFVTAMGFAWGLAITLSAKRVASESDAAEQAKKRHPFALFVIGGVIVALAVLIPWFMRQSRLTQELLDSERQALASTERKPTEQAGLALSVPFKSPDDAVVHFELVNPAGDSTSLTINQYVRGVCLSHDGLVVTATPRSVFDQAQSVSVFSPYKGKARVVAEDKDHSLTLLQLDVADKSTYFWLKCRSELPVLGQRLIALGASQKPILTVVSHVNRAFQKPRKGSDGFLMQPFALPQPGFPVEDALWHGLPTGSPIVSNSDELQGLAVDSSGLQIEPPSGDENPNIPSSHIQNLLTAYQQAVGIVDKTTEADPQTGEIIGFLKNDSGESIRNATIACSCVYDKTGQGGGANTVTDAEGMYRFTGLTEGIYSICLKHYENPHFTAVADDGIEVTVNQPAASSLRLVPTIHLTGVLTQEGKPATKGTPVHCFCSSRPESSASGLTALTDEQGRFAFDLPYGRASFFAMGRSQNTNVLVAKAQFMVGQANDAAKETFGDVHLELLPRKSEFGSTDWLDRAPPGTEVVERKSAEDITGTIVDPEGHPIESAKIFTEADLQPVESDKNGFFRFPKAKGTQTIMRAFKAGYHIWMGMPTAGDRLKIVLEKKESKQVSTSTASSKTDPVNEKQHSGEAGDSASETDALTREVDRFNRDLRPSTQPPLTRDEVIACASWNEDKADLSQAIKNVLGVIATQHRLIVGWRFAAQTQDTTLSDASIRVFRVFLVKDGSEQQILIRERFIAPLNINHKFHSRTKEQGGNSLSAAIERFNASHNTANGIKQPPLTYDEVVAAILNEQTRRDRHEVDEALFQQYQDIARTSTLPKDAAIEVIPTFETAAGSTFTIWSVRIRLPHAASDESKGSYAFTIREQFILVKHSDAGEIHWGPPSAGGMQVGTRLRPPLKNYSIGQKVVVEFVYRNVLTKPLEASIPNIPHYEIEVRDARGTEVQTRNPSLEVVAGYQLERMIDGEQVTRTAQQLLFAQKSVKPDDGLSDPAGIQSHVFVEAGESYRIQFSVPDPSSERTEQLSTGEIEIMIRSASYLNAPGIPLSSDDMGTSSYESRPVGDWSDAMQKLAAAVSMNSEVGKVSIEELIRWGEPNNGLQAGLLIPTQVTHGEQIEARLVLRKITGEPEQLTLNGRHVQLVAHTTDHRIHPASLDSLLVPLRPQVVIGLRNGEQIEFPNRRIQFGGSLLPDIRKAMFVGSDPGMVRVKFVLLQPDGAGLPTGEAEVRVNEDASEVNDGLQPFGKESNGLQVRLIPLSPDVSDETPELRRITSSFKRSEDMTFAVQIKNVSRQAISIAGIRNGEGYAPETRGKLNTAMLAPHWFEFEFTDANGRPIPRTPRREFYQGWYSADHASVHVLAPDESLIEVFKPTRFMEPMNYDLLPGQYRVKVKYRGPNDSLREFVRKHWPEKPILNAWPHEVVSNVSDFAIEESSNRTKPEDLVWGKPVDGLQAALEYRLPDNAGDPLNAPGVAVGTALGITFHVRNVSDKPITFISETSRQGDYAHVTDESGQEVEVKSNFYTGEPIDVAWKLMPGEVAQLNLLTPGLGSLDKPGQYKVRYTIRFNSRIQKDEAGIVTFPRPGDYDKEVDTGETPLYLQKSKKEISARGGNAPDDSKQLSRRPPVSCVLLGLNKPGTVEVEVSVGFEDGIRPGDKLEAIHDGQVVGKVEITRAEASRSKARIVEVVPGKALDQGDNVELPRQAQPSLIDLGDRPAVPLFVVPIGTPATNESDDKEPQQPVSQSETDSPLKLRPVELNGQRLIELARGDNKQTAFRFIVQTDSGQIEVTPSANGLMRIVRGKFEMFAGELSLVSSPEHLQISSSVN